MYRTISDSLHKVLGETDASIVIQYEFSVFFATKFFNKSYLSS